MPAGSPAMIARACSAVTRRLLGAKTKPTASAPASMAAIPSSTEVVAQILIQIRMFGCSGFHFKSEAAATIKRSVDFAAPGRRRTGRLGIKTRFFQQRPQFFAGIFGAHQGLSDQEGLIARVEQISDLGALADSAFGDAQHARRNPGGEVPQGFGSDFEGL